MIADCETCERKQIPCSGCEESQRTICFICQGDIADPYCELEIEWHGAVSGRYDEHGKLTLRPRGADGKLLGTRSK